ncbi:S8 family serine peptidase [Fibrella sp. WM1]|uniref:S8 family serine peptidase n=1 Tax=Fibrella musci TaxID=3242485 RepID=UPI00351FB64D
MTTLVFKFRDDLLPRRGAVWLEALNLSEAFFEQAEAFLQQNGTAANPVKGLLQLLPRRKIASLMEAIRSRIGVLPYSPFDAGGYEKLSRLAQRIRAYNLANGAPTAPSQLPNLFNYFQIDFPEPTDESTIQFVLGLFEAFLPHKAWFGFYLFDFVYLKDEPVSLSDTTPLEALKKTPNAGQFYFADMAIPSAMAASVAPGVTIIEADGWDLTHPQFAALHPTVVPIETKPFDPLSVPKQSGKLDHGTQILGVLAARNTDADTGPAPLGDVCRGIAPGVTIRLVSCLAKGTVLAGQGFKTIRYNELAAVLTAIDVTPSGETILIELGTAGGRFPLDVLPGVYELLAFADQLDITVIAAAGNDKAILSTAPKNGTDEPLLPRDVRLAALTSQLDNHSQTHWNAYTNKKNRDRINALYERHKGQIPSTVSKLSVPQFASSDAFLAYYQETPSPAILVGAASRVVDNQSVTFRLLDNSSRGNRVRVFAQGGGILTTTIDGRYTADMSDTSGAAAIIAGIVLLLQQKAKSVGNAALNPQTIAGWLTEAPTSGTVTTPQDQLAGLDAGVVPSCKTLLSHV